MTKEGSGCLLMKISQLSSEDPTSPLMANYFYCLLANGRLVTKLLLNIVHSFIVKVLSTSPL